MKTFNAIMLVAGLLLTQNAMAAKYWCGVNDQSISEDGTSIFNRQVVLKVVDSEEKSVTVHQDGDIVYAVSFQDNNDINLTIANMATRQILAATVATTEKITVVGGNPLRAFTCVKMQK